MKWFRCTTCGRMVTDTMIDEITHKIECHNPALVPDDEYGTQEPDGGHGTEPENSPEPPRNGMLIGGSPLDWKF